MDLSISEEQSAIRDVISRFIENEYDFEKRMSIAEGDSAFDSDVYNFFVEQADKMNVSYKLDHLLKPESIINTCLSFFEQTLAVEKISGVFFRNYNLRLQMSPAIK